ncbi:MAG: MSMEG_4193 family putative phosphomutase [Actinomadura sp.]
MTTLLLVRHGLTKLTGPVLAGWTPDLHLDERGQAQARELAARIAAVPLTAVVSSPLDRCRETADAIVAARAPAALAADTPVDKVEIDDRFGEVRYGDWTGRPLKELAKEPLWRVVQAHPSAARFPGEDGESLAEAQHRAVAAVRDWNSRLGPDTTYLVCSHGDIIKAIVADALGLHLDQFQRIQADPASLTVIRYTELRPFVARLNDTGGGVDDLLTKPGTEAGEDGDAPVGGGG